MAEIHVASLLNKYESRKAIIAALSPVTGLEATITVIFFFSFLFIGKNTCAVSG